jgi:IS5 family transposase
MRQADRVLEDEELIGIVYEALQQRHPKSRTCGRLGVAAEIVVRYVVAQAHP